MQGKSKKLALAAVLASGSLGTAAAAAFLPTPVGVFIPPVARVAAVAAAGAASAQLAGLPAGLAAHLTRLDSRKREEAVYFQSALGGVFSAARASANEPAAMRGSVTWGLRPGSYQTLGSSSRPWGAQSWRAGADNSPTNAYSSAGDARAGMASGKLALARRTFLIVSDELFDRRQADAWRVALVARDAQGREVARLTPDPLASEALSASRWLPGLSGGQLVWRGAQRYVFKARDAAFEVALRGGVCVSAELDRGRGPEAYPIPASLE